jgi:hypothetical protein
MAVPRKIAIVPFRDRSAQLSVLLPILQAHFDQILIVELQGSDEFDRGWVKNVGFRLSLAGPLDTVYFHDVDILPVSADWQYPDVHRGQVLHLYGHRHCLGGIVGVDPAVFTTVGGFSHAKHWGGEDRHLQQACTKLGIPIDRDRFCERFSDPRIVVELNAHGRPQDVHAGKAELQQKWQTSKAVPCAPGLLHHVRYRVHELRPISARVRHYVVGEESKK